MSLAIISNATSTFLNIFIRRFLIYSFTCKTFSKLISWEQFCIIWFFIILFKILYGNLPILNVIIFKYFIFFYKHIRILVNLLLHLLLMSSKNLILFFLFMRNLFFDSCFQNFLLLIISLIPIIMVLAVKMNCIENLKLTRYT